MRHSLNGSSDEKHTASIQKSCGGNHLDIACLSDADICAAGSAYHGVSFYNLLVHMGDILKNIKQKREAAGLSQEALAKQMKVNVRTVQRWEATGKVRNCYLTDLKGILS